MGTAMRFPRYPKKIKQEPQEGKSNPTDFQNPPPPKKNEKQTEQTGNKKKKAPSHPAAP